MNRKLIAIGLSGLVLAGIAATQCHFISPRTANDNRERVSPAPLTAANATSDQVVRVDQGVTHQLARPEPRSEGNVPGSSRRDRSSVSDFCIGQRRVPPV